MDTEGQDINAENASSSTTSNATNATTTSQVPRSGLPPFPPFNPYQDTATVGQRWTKWVRRFENLLIRLRAFDFTQHFVPQGNTDMAIFDFRELKQGSNETLNEYYRRLKTKAVQCNFHSEEAEIKTQIIHKTRDSRLRKKALRETMTLKQILDYGNTLERTDEQSKRLDNASKFQSESNETVNYNYNEKNSKQHRKFPTSGGSNSRYRTPKKPDSRFQGNKYQKEAPDSGRKSQTCRSCGGKFPHKDGIESCPARDLNLRTVEMSDMSTKRKVVIIFKTRTMNFFLLSTQAR
ncbi:Hypothetical predicted protein, partial [Paramuricea clavata]